jgi:CheY-like chemotaxis protein
MATVLVVDDDEMIRNLVVMLLKRNGHEVLWAANGLEALMVYSSYRARLDLVLTDIDMPQMNGIELAARIRARDPSGKILLMTGRAFDIPNGGEKLPLLTKPFRPDELIVAVEDALGKA